MKKSVSILAAIALALTLTGCNKKLPDIKPINSSSKTQSTSSSKPVQSQNTTSSKPDTSSEPIEGDPAEYSMDFWAAKYPGKNICPFYIEVGGIEKPYYLIMEMGGTMEEWINTPFNWNGWHKVGNDIVNKDETAKITADWIGEEATSYFSSFCTVTTEPFDSSSAPSMGHDTVSGYLSSFGLTEDAFKCANFTRLDATSRVVDTNEIKQVGSYISSELSDDDVKDWLVKFVSKLRELSDDCKVFNSGIMTEGNDEWTDDFVTGEKSQVYGFTILDGTFTYKGKTVGLSIQISKGFLDSSDPDMAAPAILVDLRFE